MRYRPMGPVAAVVQWIFSGGMALLFAGIGLFCLPDDEPRLWTAVWIAAGLFWLVPGYLLGQPVRVEVDRGAGTLLLARARWPRRANARTIPLARVRDAVVLLDPNPTADALRYMVALVVDGEPPVPLLEGMWGPDEARHEKVAAAIRALLERPAA